MAPYCLRRPALNIFCNLTNLGLPQRYCISFFLFTAIPSTYPTFFILNALFFFLFCWNDSPCSKGFNSKSDPSCNLEKKFHLLLEAFLSTLSSLPISKIDFLFLYISLFAVIALSHKLSLINYLWIYFFSSLVRNCLRHLCLLCSSWLLAQCFEYNFMLN